MKTPREVWEAFANDERWVDDQVAVVGEIMREAFGAGFAAGVELATNAIDGHAAGLASNLAVRVPESITRGLTVVADRLRDYSKHSASVLHAWHSAVGPRLLKVEPPR